MSLLRRRMMMENIREAEWLYEAVLTDSGAWYGARCPAIIFDVKAGEKYLIEWSNCKSTSKYVYDMRKCGGYYLLVGSKSPDGIAEPSGIIEIEIPEDGTLYIGTGSNVSGAIDGGIYQAGTDADYIRIKKI